MFLSTFLFLRDHGKLRFSLVCRLSHGYAIVSYCSTYLVRYALVTVRTDNDLFYVTVHVPINDDHVLTYLEVINSSFP